jgi:hypothetical protein
LCFCCEKRKLIRNTPLFALARGSDFVGRGVTKADIPPILSAGDVRIFSILLLSVKVIRSHFFFLILPDFFLYVFL